MNRPREEQLVLDQLVTGVVTVDGRLLPRWAQIKSTARRVWVLVHAAPAVTGKIVAETGVSPSVARAAQAAALVGDYMVPGVPTGSLAISVVATLATGGRAPVSVVQQALETYRERKAAGRTRPDGEEDRAAG